MNLLPLSVGLGLATSLLLSEVLGIASGGLVVPGYVALLIDQPWQLLSMLLAALLTWATVEALATVTILFGRRRTTLTLLLGYVAHFAVREGLLAGAHWLGSPMAEGLSAASGEAVGLIVPGLLALWISRQGLAETMSALCCATALVRLSLILILGDEVGK